VSRIALAETEAAIARCFPVMVELRTHIGSEAAFVDQVKRQAAEGGYRLAYLEDEGEIVAVAGYRVSESLIMGKALYVDDLVTTSAHRSRGYGDALIDWLAATGRSEGCQRLHLDSSIQRGAAHRFYFRKGMEIAAYHFSMPLD
jgi:GNAT superfamily N-acetyltransferase